MAKRKTKDSAAGRKLFEERSGAHKGMWWGLGEGDI